MALNHSLLQIVLIVDCRSDPTTLDGGQQHVTKDRYREPPLAVSDTDHRPVVPISLSGPVTQQRGYPVTAGDGDGEGVEVFKISRWGRQMKPLETIELRSPDLTRLQKINAVENPKPFLSLRRQPLLHGIGPKHRVHEHSGFDQSRPITRSCNDVRSQHLLQRVGG